MTRTTSDGRKAAPAFLALAAVGFIALIAFMNLKGVRESGVEEWLCPEGHLGYSEEFLIRW